MRLNDPLSLALPNTSADEAPRPAVAVDVAAKAKTAAEKFEAYFIAEMLHKMRRSAREFGDRGDAPHSGSHDDMLDLADGMVADALARRHAFGVADLILRQLLPAPQTAPESPAFKSPPPPVALNK